MPGQVMFKSFSRFNHADVSSAAECFIRDKEVEGKVKVEVVSTSLTHNATSNQYVYILCYKEYIYCSETNSWI